MAEAANDFLTVDTVTHALIGVLAVRAGTKPHISDNQRELIIPIYSAVLIGAIFPDLDYVLFWWDPYRFITLWHRGITHSIVMLPLWSVFLGLTVALCAHRPSKWRMLSGWCALGLSCHVATDVVTVFGIQIFAPLSDYRLALNLAFDIDPWVALIAATSLAASYGNRLFARWGLTFLVIYFAGRVFLYQSAVYWVQQSVKDTRDANYKVMVFPQPLSPFHWKAVIERPASYKIAFLNLLDLPRAKLFFHREIAGSGNLPYRPADNLVWRQRFRFGGKEADRAVAKHVWNHDRLAQFRRFSVLPVLYRIDRDKHEMCVWFTDLRYVFIEFEEPFRYGMCQLTGQAQWRLFRLKRLTEDDRQPLEKIG